MATHSLVYLTCDECGDLFYDGDTTAKTEEENEIRGWAEDEGWAVDYENGRDVCPKCKAKGTK